MPVAGSFTTLEPSSQLNVVVNIGDGQEVGIAAPIILKFNGTVEDKEAVERALTVTATPPTEGAWAWLGEDNGSRVHWRPREYWAPGTKVHMDAKLYGLDHGGGAYGAANVTSDFTIGRAQVVKADAPSHRIVVIRDGAELMALPCSYGEGDLDRNVTRSGIHVVTEKYDEFFMSNPPVGYFNIRERWAVRISNNGEFIHANPETVNVQGAANVTNGCINLSEADAERYFRTAIYGDPVEVTVRGSRCRRPTATSSTGSSTGRPGRACRPSRVRPSTRRCRRRPAMHPPPTRRHRARPAGLDVAPCRRLVAGLEHDLVQIHVRRTRRDESDHLGDILCGQRGQTLVDGVGALLVAVETHQRELGLHHAGQISVSRTGFPSSS